MPTALELVSQRDGITHIKLMLDYVNEKGEHRSHPHRTTFNPDTPPRAQMQAVNNHLVSMRADTVGSDVIEYLVRTHNKHLLDVGLVPIAEA